MYSIAHMVHFEYEIQKSKFYSFLFPVTCLEDIRVNLDNIKKKYPNATHYCYAYIIDQVKRCSDDGEPSKTAGMPILNVLEKRELNFVLCVVVRYFGGTLLGTGGLVRAYSTSVTKALECACIKKLKIGHEMELVFYYEDKNLIDKILGNTDILDVSYQDTITYQVKIVDEFWNSILNIIIPHLKSYRIMRECYCVLD